MPELFQSSGLVTEFISHFQALEKLNRRYTKSLKSFLNSFSGWFYLPGKHGGYNA
jgi:hypothetical protein